MQIIYILATTSSAGGSFRQVRYSFTPLRRCFTLAEKRIFNREVVQSPAAKGKLIVHNFPTYSSLSFRIYAISSDLRLLKIVLLLPN